MKGQFFILAAVVMAVSLLMIKDMFDAYLTIQTTEHQSLLYTREVLDDILGEYDYIVETAACKNAIVDEAEAYLSDFTSKLAEENPITMLFFFSAFNSSSGHLNFSVGNFLGDVVSVNITITNGTTTVTKKSVIADRAVFNSDVTISGVANITLSYEFCGEERSDTLKLDLSATKLYLFIDLKMEYQDKTIRRKHVYEKRLV